MVSAQSNEKPYIDNEGLNIIQELLDCCELNMDAMEPDTLDITERAQAFLREQRKVRRPATNLANKLFGKSRD
jgi:hypothetical protein